MEFTIKKFIALLVAIVSVLTSIIAVLVLLPQDDTVTALIAGLSALVIAFGAVIKMLRQYDSEIETKADELAALRNRLGY